MCLAYESLSDNFTLICLGSFLLKILRVTQKLSFAMCNAVQCRTINRRSRLTIPSMFISSMWDVKEPTHYSIRVGHEVPVLWLSLVSVWVGTGWVGELT